MIKLFKSILIILFFGAYGYFLGEKLGGGLLPNVLNILLVFSILFLYSQKLNKLIIPKGFYIIKLFFVLIFFSFLLAIARLEFRSSVPTFMRFCLYFLSFLYGYSLLKLTSFEYFYKNLIYYIRLSLWFAVGLSLYQISTGDLQFGNMIYRVSGPFYFHASGFSLFLVSHLGILYSLKIRKVDKRSYFDILLFIIGGYILLRTGSRAGFIGFILVILLDLVIINLSYFKVFVILPVIIFISIETFPILIEMQSATRIRYLIEKGEDGSTATRLRFIHNSLQHFRGSEEIIGQGLGSFALFYKKIEGRKVAAHNNFLQFYIEGGALGLLGYILLIIYFGYMSIFKLDRRNRFHFALFFLILNIEGFGLVNNNFYYPISEFFVWFFLGLVCYDIKMKSALLLKEYP